jgi:hypothetical protein
MGASDLIVGRISSLSTAGEAGAHALPISGRRWFAALIRVV